MAKETISVRNVLNPPTDVFGRRQWYAWELRVGERVVASGTAETAKEARRAAGEASARRTKAKGAQPCQPD